MRAQERAGCILLYSHRAASVTAAAICSFEGTSGRCPKTVTVAELCCDTGTLMKKNVYQLERSIADGNFDFLTRVTERPYFASTRRQVACDSGCRFAGRRTSTGRLWLSHTARGWRTPFQGALCTATGPHWRLILSKLEVRTRRHRGPPASGGHGSPGLSLA